MEGSSVFHRSIQKTYPTANKGSGVYLHTSDGRKILDGSSGAAVSSLGHGNQEIINAICEQAQSLAFAHSSFFTSDPSEDLAKLIIKYSDDTFAKVMFLTSGSEAVESALKVARQYHIYKGEPERVNYIGRDYSYHGNTLGALGAGNNPARRGTFAPILGPTFHHVSRCFYDADGQGRTEKEYEDALIAEYEEKIESLGPETVAAVIVEPVGGATLGSVPATKTYLPRLSALCKQYGILTIFDEVMCGMGRVGSYHAWQSLGGVAPDLQTIGKGLGGGYQPLSAVLIGQEVQSTFEEHSKGSQAFVSGHTFQDHSMGCAAAMAAQRILSRDNLVTASQRQGEFLAETLKAQLPPSFESSGGSIRGLGLFQTVDFGALSEKYGGGPLAKEVAERTFARGAAVYLCSSAVDAVLFAPPFIISEEEVKELVGMFVGALEDVLASRQSS